MTGQEHTAGMTDRECAYVHDGEPREDGEELCLAPAKYVVTDPQMYDDLPAVETDACEEHAAQIRADLATGHFHPGYRIRSIPPDAVSRPTPIRYSSSRPVIRAERPE